MLTRRGLLPLIPAAWPSEIKEEGGGGGGDDLQILVCLTYQANNRGFQRSVHLRGREFFLGTALRACLFVAVLMLQSREKCSR